MSDKNLIYELVSILTEIRDCLKRMEERQIDNEKMITKEFTKLFEGVYLGD